MKVPNKTQLKSWAAGTLVASGLVVLSDIAAADMAPANADIFNQATVTYEDNAGNQLSKTSDQALVKVAQVYASEFGSDYLDLQAVSGQSVNFAHTVKNNGNGPDSFTFTLTDLTTASGGLSTSTSFKSGSLQAFVDDNCNAVRDAGENTTITGSGGLNNVAPGDTVCLVVQAQVSPTATNGNTSGYTLAINNTGGGIVELGGGTGADNFEKTNNGIVTVTDVVLDISKTATLDEANQTVSYEVTFTNNGPGLARNVLVYDALPAVQDNGNVISTELSGTFLATTTDSGSLTTSLSTTAEPITETDIAPAGAFIDLDGDNTPAETTEVELGIDLNNDGLITPDTVSGVWAYKESLAPNATITLSFTVSYAAVADSFPAGTRIANIARFMTDNNADNSTDDSGELGASTPANGTVVTTQATVFGFAFTETLDDGDNNTAQVTVPSADFGTTAVFSHTITNNANGADTFTLDVVDFTGAGNSNCQAWPVDAPATEPVYQFRDDSGTIMTQDGNGQYSYTVDQAGSRVFTVEVSVPGSSAATGDFCLTINARSSDDPTTPSQVVTDVLSAITEPVISANIADLLLTSSLVGNVINNGLNDDALPTAADSRNANVGDTIRFEISINNESNTGDSYTLEVASSETGNVLDDAFSSARFYLVSAPTEVITSTPLIPAAGTLDLYVDVAVTSIASLTSSQVYDLFIKIVGNSQLANSDTMKVNVQIAETEILTLSPDNNGQIGINDQASYIHTAINEGNTTETITIAVTNDINSGDFNTSIYAMVDTDNDGSPDTPVTVGNIDNVNLGETGNATITATLTTLELTLNPGDRLAFSINVSSTSSAAQGDSDSTRVTLSWNTSDSTFVTNLTTVVSIQLDLIKRVALDADCNGEPDEAFATIGTPAAPGQCVIWQVTVLNDSITDDANNVVISDAVPVFTMLTNTVSGDSSLESCAVVVSENSSASLESACPASSYCRHSYAADNEAACATADADGQLSISGGAINFFVGTNADGAGSSGEYRQGTDARRGGVVAKKSTSTSSANGYTVRFSVKVDE